MVKTTMIPYFALLYFTYDLIHLKNPVRRYVEYKKSRGMSMMTDWIDWIGGYPFEVASVKAITEFYEQRGFSILKVAPNKSHGCNEFVFIKNP